MDHTKITVRDCTKWKARAILENISIFHEVWYSDCNHYDNLWLGGCMKNFHNYGLLPKLDRFGKDVWEKTTPWEYFFRHHPNLNCVIWDKKMFFPPHEHVIRPIQLLVVKCVRVEGLGILVECKKLALKINIWSIWDHTVLITLIWVEMRWEWETDPMFFVDVLISVPLARQERVLFTDDLTVKKGHLDKR